MNIRTKLSKDEEINDSSNNGLSTEQTESSKNNGNNNQSQQSASPIEVKNISDLNFVIYRKWFEDKNILDLLMNAPLTDTGNAICFALLNKDSLRYCKVRKKWLNWSGYKWTVITDGEAQRAAITTIKARKRAASYLKTDEQRNILINWAKQSESVAKRHAILNTAMHLKPIETNISLFDQNPSIAGVKNGTLDLETGEVRESNRDNYLSMSLNVHYNSFAEAPRWKQFLEEIFTKDKELISFIQRAIGYSLTGDTSEQVLFICHGNGANGKSVFLDIISELLGDYSATCPFSTFEANRRNDASNDLAMLKGRRFVSVIESNEDRRLDEARVKSVTGQDFITCRFLYGEFFTYKPSFKLWMAVNHKPLIRGTDRGIWRRIRLIPFNRNFEEKADPYLIHKLKEELPGILNWAIEGLKEWQRIRLGTAKAIEEASENYRKESDLLQQWLDENTSLNENEETPCSEAYAYFREWCINSGYPVWSKNSFGRGMTEKGFERKSDGKARSYTGLVMLISPN